MAPKYSDIVTVLHTFNDEPMVRCQVCRYWAQDGGQWYLDDVILLHCERAAEPHDPIDLPRVQLETILDMATAIPREEGQDILPVEDSLDPDDQEEPEWTPHEPDADWWYDVQRDEGRWDPEADKE